MFSTKVYASRASGHHLAATQVECGDIIKTDYSVPQLHTGTATFNLGAGREKHVLAVDQSDGRLSIYFNDIRLAIPPQDRSDGSIYAKAKGPIVVDNIIHSNIEIELYTLEHELMQQIVNGVMSSDAAQASVLSSKYPFLNSVMQARKTNFHNAVLIKISFSVDSLSYHDNKTKSYDLVVQLN